MWMSRRVVCVILAVLQLGVEASVGAEELQMSKQQFMEMQRQMATEKQEIQQQLGNELRQMQRQMASQQHEIEQNRVTTDELMKQQLKAIQQQLATQRDERQQMQQKMSNLEKENFKLEQNINNLNSTLANIVHENQQLSEIVSVLKQERADLSLGFQNVSDLVGQAVGSKHNGTFIGFSAYASEYRNYDNGNPVLFDYVITNVGSFYTPDPSVFLCGYQGYYLFSLNVHAYTGQRMEAELIMNNNSIARVYADETEQDTGSNTVVVWCPQFHQVYVRASNSGHTMYGDPTHELSTFTGVFLARQ